MEVFLPYSNRSKDEPEVRENKIRQYFMSLINWGLELARPRL